MDGKTIKRLRGKLGLSQEGMARKIGVSWVTVSNWERGKHKPSTLAVIRLKELGTEQK